MIKLVRPINLIIAGVWLGAVVLVMAVMNQPRPPQPSGVVWTPSVATPVPLESLPVISLGELAANDGQNGRKCFAAVKGLVYLIPESSVWRNGDHLPSNGVVYCGRDLTGKFDDSPHGDAVMSSLDIVGKL